MSKREIDRQTENVTKRLDAIIHILLETARPGGKKLPIPDQVEMLYNSGLKATEIAKILNLKLSHVAVTIYRKRKKLKIRK